MAKGNHISIGVDPIRTLEDLEKFVRNLREKAGDGNRYIDVRLTWGGKINGCVIDMDGQALPGGGEYHPSYGESLGGPRIDDDETGLFGGEQR